MIAHENLVACVEREIRMRERVYPRWVFAERMTQARADAELAQMKAVLAFLLEHAPPAPPPAAQRDLFGGSR